MLGFIGDLLGLNKGDPAIKAAGENKLTLGGYKTDANSLIDKGAATTGDYLKQILGLYSGNAASGVKGTALAADALGINGASGNDRATAAFQTNPGYEFQRDQGLQALDRSASARGSFQSGGAEADTLKYATGLADQSYDTWLQNLLNPNNTVNGAVTGAAGALGGLGTLSQNTTGAKLGVLGDYTSGLLGATNQKAGGESANKSGLSNLFGTAVGAFTGYGGF